MNRLTHKRQLKQRRKARVRTSVVGTTERPRLTVSISSSMVRAQIIDDAAGKTLVSAASSDGKTLTEKAAATGAAIGQEAKKKKISSVVFDTNGRQYQQRLQAFAEAARNEGLEF